MLQNTLKQKCMRLSRKRVIRSKAAGRRYIRMTYGRERKSGLDGATRMQRARAWTRLRWQHRSRKRNRKLPLPRMGSQNQSASQSRALLNLLLPTPKKHHQATRRRSFTLSMCYRIRLACHLVIQQNNSSATYRTLVSTIVCSSSSRPYRRLTCPRRAHRIGQRTDTRYYAQSHSTIAARVDRLACNDTSVSTYGK